MGVVRHELWGPLARSQVAEAAETGSSRRGCCTAPQRRGWYGRGRNDGRPSTSTRRSRDAAASRRRSGGAHAASAELPRRKAATRCRLPSSNAARGGQRAAGVAESASPIGAQAHGAPLNYVRRAASVSGGGGGAAQPTDARAGGGSLSSGPAAFRRAPGGSGTLDSDADYPRLRVTVSAKPDWRAGSGAPLDYVRRAASVSGGGGGAAQPTGARAGGGSLSSRPTTFRRAPGGSSSLDGDANTFVQRGAGRPTCRDADLFWVRTMEWALGRLDALCGVAGQAWRHWRTAETIISLPPLSTGEST